MAERDLKHTEGVLKQAVDQVARIKAEAEALAKMTPAQRAAKAKKAAHDAKVDAELMSHLTKAIPQLKGKVTVAANAVSSAAKPGSPRGGASRKSRTRRPSQ